VRCSRRAAPAAWRAAGPARRRCRPRRWSGRARRPAAAAGAPRRRQRRAGRVVQHRHRDVQPRPVRAQQRFQHRQVGAVGAARHRQQAQAQRVRRANSTAQPGSSTSTASPGCSSVRDTMSSACVAPTVVTTCSGEAGTPMSASRRDSAWRRRRAAGRVAVAQPGLRAGAAGGAAQRALQQPGVQPVLGQRAHAGRRCAAAHLEHAADQRRGVHRGRRARRCALGRACGRARGAHEEAALRSRLDQPLGLQQVVGADHGGRADAVAAAQSRTDGSRAPGASRRCSMRSAKRCASCPASVAPAARARCESALHWFCTGRRLDCAADLRTAGGSSPPRWPSRPAPTRCAAAGAVIASIDLYGCALGHATPRRRCLLCVAKCTGFCAASSTSRLTGRLARCPRLPWCCR
jgi:hypothetical protein